MGGATVGSLPLKGRRIVVTRAREQADSLVAALRRRGADVIEAPAIRIEPPEDWRAVDGAIDRLHVYDWVLFTSANGVRFFCKRMGDRGVDSGVLKKRKLAAIGPATAASLRREGLGVDVTPREFVAEALFEAIQKAGPLEGRRCLLPRADIAREALPQLLRSAGAVVDVVVAYRTLAAREEITATTTRILRQEIDAVTFTSGSTVRSFFGAIPHPERIRDKFACASIGPITSRALRELDFEPKIEARDYTTDGLVEALVEHFQGR